MTGRVFHLDCPSGLAGDMFLGACIDLGMPLGVIQQAVEQLGLGGFGEAGITVEATPGRRGGLQGTSFRVLRDGVPLEEAVASGERAEARDWAAIRGMLGGSALPGEVKQRALRLFTRLAEVEGALHGVSPERVHFHEVGAVDSIVDIVGAAAAYDWLAPERLTCGTIVVGSGTVDTEHGVLPVPAPATARLLEGLPITAGPPGELVTPTGALLLAELVDEPVVAPEMVLEGQGYGLGRREVAGRANAVRLLRGHRLSVRERLPSSLSAAQGRVCVIECQLDDLPGEAFGYLLERLLEEGALDVYYTPIQMKKGRPGVHVTVLGRPHQLEALAGLLLVESGSLGCRYSEKMRLEAERETLVVETAWGAVRCKRASFAGRPLVTSPEFEDCRTLARQNGVPWREVHRAALVAASAAGDAPWVPGGGATPPESLGSRESEG